MKKSQLLNFVRQAYDEGYAVAQRRPSTVAITPEEYKRQRGGVLQVVLDSVEDELRKPPTNCWALKEKTQNSYAGWEDDGDRSELDIEDDGEDILPNFNDPVVDNSDHISANQMDRNEARAGGR